MSQRIQIPFVGGAYESRSLNINAQQSINFFPVLDQQGGKTPMALVSTPGLPEWTDLNDTSEVRKMYDRWNNNLYALCGNTVYEITGQNVYTALGTVKTNSGPAWFEDNGSQLMIVDGASGWIYDKSTFTEISDPDFIRPSGLTYQDGYFLVPEKDTQKIWQSELNDGTAWNAFDFSSAEGLPDDLVCAISDHNELWLLGGKTAEPWYNSKASGFSFSRLGGTFMERGCGAAGSVCKLNNTLYWLDDHRVLIEAQGYTPNPVSTPQIEYQFSKYSHISDAMAYAYEFEGHAFYVVNVANKTWVYDASTGFWHERKSYQTGSVDQGRHRGNCYAYFNDLHLVGDYENGKIYRYDPNIYSENGQILRSVRRTPYVHSSARNVFIHWLEIDFEGGVGIATGQGSDPQVMLRWSTDNGHTWSNEHWRSLGKIGEYDQRVRWGPLGVGRQWIFEVAITDPVKRVILGAYADITVGKH